jgi:hypothetical protein
MKTFRKIFLIALLGLLGLCLVAVAAAAISNAGLPDQSGVVDRFSDLEKARLAETLHFRRELGEQVWPGWGEADIPIIVYNEAYAFLTGYPNPPDGWVKVPGPRPEGRSWEVVPGDDFLGQPYYRQALPDPEINPQNFVVLVGERWVATMQTKEYSAVDFYNDFPEELPPVVRTIMPYRLVWGILGGDTEVSIGGLLHESFHAFQGMQAADRLEQAELSLKKEKDYPWEDEAFEASWDVELGLLAEVSKVTDVQGAASLAERFLQARQERRLRFKLGSELVDLEREREWLEGLAKYVELTSTRTAGQSSTYQPEAAILEDPDFESYQGSLRFYQGQIAEIRRMNGGRGETRFYYTGFAQGILLDWLDPGWKEKVLAEGAYLEDLLGQALAGK